MRIRLVSDGNYPVVRGGVTRWCDLLVQGLAHHAWHVTALGVPADAASLRSVPMDCVDPVQLRPGRSWRGRTSVLPARVAAALFSATGDPSALAAALGACSADPDLPARVGSPGTRRAVQEAVRVVLGEHGEDREAVRTAMDTTAELVAIAARGGPPADLCIATTAGAAAVPAIVENVRGGTPFVVVEHGVAVREAYLRTLGADVGVGVRAVVRRAALNLARTAYALSSTVVGVSAANASWSTALGADRGRVVTVPNGVPAVADPPPRPGLDRIGMVGRVDPFKGLDVFVRAARLVADTHPRATFVHVGGAEPCHATYLDECRRLVAREGLGDRVEIVGEVDDVGALLASMDVVALPSRTEGLPYALLEAMASARPVVASAVGGVPEALRGAGVLVDPGDPVALAAGLRSVLDDPDLAGRMAGAAAGRVRDRFSLDAMLARMEAIVSAATDRVGVAA